MDGKQHEVAVYFDASSEVAVDHPAQAVTFESVNVAALAAWRVGTVAQPILQKKGDDLRIDWGYFYVALPKTRRAESTVNAGEAARASFIAGQSLIKPESADGLQDNARNDSVIAFAMDLGSVGDQAASCWLMLAYDDPSGVTAAFNKNLLARINRELDADFDLRHFEHVVRYDETERRVEMHLRSTVWQRVTIRKAGFRFYLREGETIWTESSHKYDPQEVIQMGERCGYRCAGQWIDREWPFAQNLFFAV